MPEEWLRLANDSWQVHYCLRLVLAALLGGLVGIEREYHGRSAGFRTQLLVALGSALAMVVSLHFADVYGMKGPNTTISIDPARIAYGVMGGIGFLGAGAILKYGLNIQGMTTAASLWCTAALGLACGFGMYWVSVVATAIILFALLVLYKIDASIIINWYKQVTVTVTISEKGNIKRFRDLLISQGARVVDIEYTRDNERGVETIRYFINTSSRGKSFKVDWFDGEKDVLQVNVK